MQQHPVPQPITSYEFRLVGDMTLRQFAKLAAGAILALIVYAINPPGLIKWFFVFLFGGGGAAMAFVPFEGRPIDVWVMAFFKRIYSPTQYVWRQINKNNLPSTIEIPPKAPKIEADSSLLPRRPLAPPPPVVPVITQVPKEIVKEIPKETIFQSPAPPPKPKPQAVPVTFAKDIIFPFASTQPNLLNGYIHSKEGKLIEGAILEIRDANGIPVRAFKSSKLGQFQSATPLSSGTYEIETEKEGYSFDIIKIDLKGEVVPPIEIVSK